MVKKKSIELIEEAGNPKALIIGGKEVSSFLSKTLKDRGCEVTELASYSPIPHHFDYIFLFGNGSLGDKIYEKNLEAGGKFIFIATETDGDFPQNENIKVFQAGELSFWSPQELSDKILHAIFTSSKYISHRPTKSKPPTTEIVRPIPPVVKPIINKQPPVNAVLNPNPRKITPVVEKTSFFSSRKIFVALILLFLVILVSFAGFSFWSFHKAQKTLENLKYHLKAGDLNSFSYDLAEAKTELTNLNKIQNIAKIIFFPFSEDKQIKDIGIVLSEAEKIIDAGQEFILAAKNILPKETGIANISANFSPEKLAVFHEKTGDLLLSLTQTKLELSKVSIPFVSLSDVSTSLSPVITKLTSVYELFPTFEKIFLSNSTRVYLVLLQNNMELRPTGGFIGSYGILTVAEGKIKDFKIEDVYTADGQLKGHVDPPIPIRKHLSQPHFFLRDSNFDPDFAVSAVQAMWFLEKELGKDVDGVIGVNLTLAQKLMQLTGEVVLSDFNNERVNADNFFRKVHELTNTNFFPGSSQKKDILTAITNELIASLTNNNVNFIDLLSVGKTALEEKNILMYFKDETLQKNIEEFGWAGRMVNVLCTVRKIGIGEKQAEKECLADYISINEANLGVNKANYFINKSQILDKTIGVDGKITTTLTILYENQAVNPLETGQTYVNYLRVFVPLGSQLVNFTLNNAPLNPSDIDIQNYGNDKTSFGTLFKIAPANKGSVKITYILPYLFSPSIDSYQLFFQKQAGDKNSPLIFSLTVPENLVLKPENFSSASQKPGEIYYTTDSSVDRVFALKRDK